MRRCSVLGIIIICMALCVPATARQITDMTGQVVNIPEVVRKAYSTTPPATYMVYAISPDLIAGLNSPWETHEKRFLSASVQQLPVIGGWFGQGRTPNLETLLQVKPDVIIIWSQKDAAASRKTEEILAPLGLPVVRLRLDKLSDTPAAFRFLGELFDRKPRGEELARYTEQSLSEVESIGKTIPDAEKVTVYYAEGPDGLSTECNNSSHAELIPLCGGKNPHICETQTHYGMEKVSLEQVIQYTPEVIVTHDSVFYGAVLNDPRWQDIHAVKNRRIYKIPVSPFNWFDRPPSYMRALGAKWLLNRLYPKRYAIDIVSETKKFYQIFLNISLSEADVRELLM